jgi:hypothetical protein
MCEQMNPNVCTFKFVSWCVPQSALPPGTNSITNPTEPELHRNAPPGDPGIN